MPSSTPDWSALASENERMVLRCPAALEVVASAPAPDDEHEPAGHPAGHARTGHGTRASEHGRRRTAWRGRTARAAAPGTWQALAAGFSHAGRYVRSAG
jgi:hypothetical protein